MKASRRGGTEFWNSRALEMRYRCCDTADGGMVFHPCKLAAARRDCTLREVEWSKRCSGRLLCPIASSGSVSMCHQVKSCRRLTVTGPDLVPRVGCYVDLWRMEGRRNEGIGEHRYMSVAVMQYTLYREVPSGSSRAEANARRSLRKLGVANPEQGDIQSALISGRSGTRNYCLISEYLLQSPLKLKFVSGTDASVNKICIVADGQ